MNKTVAKWLILIALIAYAGFIAAWATRQQASQKCGNIKIMVNDEEADSLTSTAICTRLQKKFPSIIGSRRDAIDINRIEHYLKRFSNFEDVECLLAPDGTFKVIVTPLVPEIRVFDGATSYYINKEGKRIEANSDFFVDVPVVTGNFSKNFTPVKLLPVVRFIKNDSTLNALVAMIKADSPNNIIIIPRIRGHVVNIGNNTDLEDKFDRLLLAYHKILPHKGWNTYDTISVKFHGQIVASRKNKAPRFANIAEVEDIDMEESTLPQEDITTEDI